MSPAKEKDVTLHPEYENYLTYKEDKVKATTHLTIRRFLSVFPEHPDKLTYEWFQEKKNTGISVAYMNTILIQAKQFMIWAGRDYDDIERFKKDYRGTLKQELTTVTEKDLYTEEELNRLWGVLEGRDRAMIKVLYEAGCRAGELLSMQVEDLKFGETTRNGDTIEFIDIWISESKTKKRYVRLYKSVPDLKSWLEKRLPPKDKGPIWKSTRAPYKVMSMNGLDVMVRRALRQAGLEGKIKVLHMFRHTRATEIKRMGASDRTMCEMFGWAKNSNMPTVYAHLNREDAQSELDALQLGEDIERTPQEPMMKFKTCPYCKNPALDGALFCETCGKPLSEELVLQQFEDRSDLEKQIQELRQGMARIMQAINDPDRDRTKWIFPEEEKDVPQEVRAMATVADAPYRDILAVETAHGQLDEDIPTYTTGSDTPKTKKKKPKKTG